MSRTCLIVSTIFIIILGLIAVPACWAGGLIPASTSPLVTGGSGNAVLLVDLDGDGILDLVVVEKAAGQVQFYKGDGSGGFTLQKTIVVGGAPTAVAAGCLTSLTSTPPATPTCAFPDIVVANGNTTISVIQNAGAFTLTLLAGPFTLPTAGATSSAVAIADMNGDGIPDVVAADSTNNQIVVFLGDAGGAGETLTPTASTPYPVGTTPAALVVADFNNDGKPDVAVANSGSGNVTILTNSTVFPNPTDVTFAAAATSTVGTTPVAIAAGIVGASGRPDLVVANQGSTNVSVLLNNGFGVFPAGGTNTAVSAAPSGIGLGDFNADGHFDIVVSDAGGADILFNNGTGGFPGPSVNFPTGAGTNPTAIAVGDVGMYPALAADGLADVVMPDGSASKAFILLQTPFSNVTLSFAPTEGTKYLGNLVSFQYDGDSTAAHFTATVTSWGDAGATPATPAAETSVTCAAPPVCILDASSNPVTYPEEGGPKTVTITLTNTAVGPPNQTYGAQANITVTDASPLVPGVEPDLHQTEPNVTFGSIQVANFTDPNPTAPLTDFNPPTGAGATIHWADPNCLPQPACTTDTGVAVTQPGGVGTPFIIKGSHTYASNEEATYQVTFDVADVGGASISGGTGVKIIIDDAALTPTVPPPPPTPISTDATGSVSNVPIGQFTDANTLAPACPGASCDFTATIHWADTACAPQPACATSSGTVTGPVGGPYTITGSHTYFTPNSTFQVTFEVVDKGGACIGTSSPSCIPNTPATGVQITTPNFSTAPFTVLISPPQAQIHSGQSVDLLVTLAPNVPGGYPNQVTLVCGGLDPTMNCTFEPNGTLTDVTVVRQVHVLVTTQRFTAMLSAPPAAGRSAPVQLALLLPAFFGAAGVVLLTPKTRKAKKRGILWLILSFLLLATLLMGCGGGGALVAGGTPPGVYNVTIGAQSNGAQVPLVNIPVAQITVTQ